jgi:hypothetical protein
LAWIQENLHVHFPAARQMHAQEGRDALLLNTLVVVAHSSGSGNPMFY